MDRYAERLKELRFLRDKITTDIKEILSEKGYKVGDTASAGSYYTEFKIEYDRILINGTHPDQMDTDHLLKSLHEAIRLIPKV